MVTEQDITTASIAFHMWLISLQKTGYPKNEDGTDMDIWQIYQYWVSRVDQKPFLTHAKGGL